VWSRHDRGRAHGAGHPQPASPGAALPASAARKGKGFVDVSSAEECVKKGGKVIEPKKM
jgi:hypothetical protein